MWVTRAPSPGTAVTRHEPVSTAAFAQERRTKGIRYVDHEGISYAKLTCSLARPDCAAQLSLSPPPPPPPPRPAAAAGLGPGMPGKALGRAAEPGSPPLPPRRAPTAPAGRPPHPRQPLRKLLAPRRAAGQHRDRPGPTCASRLTPGSGGGAGRGRAGRTTLPPRHWLQPAAAALP